MKKMNKTLQALFTLTLLTLLVAVPATADKAESDVSTMISDATTELLVKTALLNEIGWDMLDTDVEARGSHVTLLGEADTRANSELAKEVALSVDGVEDVDNKLELVEKPTDTPVGSAVGNAEREVKDAILESRVKTALISELGTNAFDIEVEATDGTVSLRGELTSESHEEMALTTAKNCEGVNKVIDLLSHAS